jgi:hypothetical protein
VRRVGVVNRGTLRSCDSFVTVVQLACAAMQCNAGLLLRHSSCTEHSINSRGMHMLADNLSVAFRGLLGATRS